MTATVVTGVSRGLGEALFAEFDRLGHRLLALGRGFTGAQRLLASDEPDRVRLRVTDLSGPAAGLPDAAELAEFLGGEPAVLVHNAGSVEPIGAVGALDPDRLAASVAVNLTGPALLTNAFLAARGAAPARVLYISSGAAHRPIEGWATYCATKTGAEAFFDTVAAERADEKLRVANVNPGVMDTEMQAVLRAATGVHFPGRDRYVALHARGELPSPATVATRIVAEHLADL